MFTMRMTSVAMVAAGLMVGGCTTLGSKSTADAGAKSEPAPIVSRAVEKVKDVTTAVMDNGSGSMQEAEMSALQVAQEKYLLPPNARPGECYARVYVPPTYSSEQVRVLKQEAGERIEVMPPRFATAEERVLVKEASERLEVVPATYGWVEERVLVHPASKKLVEEPAVYKTVTERVLVKPAHTEWKKGTGPIQKVNNATGEIMCLVEVPATYKSVSKQVLVKPASTREIEIPAEYKTVRKQVMKTPPTTRAVVIPAQYRTVKVNKLVTDAQEKRIPIPEKYETVTKRTQVSDGRVEWRPVLCETNMRPGLISELQRKLHQAGYNPGPVDGVLGSQTMSAVRSYQNAKGMPSGGLTIDTLKSLDIGI